VQQAKLPRAAPGQAARPSARTRKAVVVIDAGHGGHDPGAPAATGGVEKDATLAIARAAKAAIEKRARAEGVAVEVRLTRDDDRFVTLGNRVKLARQWRADLFISIHADSAPNLLARGASVYTLSETASDKEAARVAAKENRSDLIAGVDLTGEDREVTSILVDLGMRDSMNASADFAQLLQKRMEPEGVPFRTQFHRFANFQVLRNLGVAAVLLETGFLSNEEDALYLFSSRGQRAIANGVADAVVDYFARR
jgi:N-acetylmuramoyl-L-alanine amidase